MMKISEYFVTAQRDDGESFVKLSDDAPEWLRDAVMDAHDGELPNDWRYAMCASIVSSLETYPADYWQDATYEIADNSTDVASSELARWLAEFPARGSDVDEYVTDRVSDISEFDAFDAIRGGQFVAIERMAYILAEAISENVSES